MRIADLRGFEDLLNCNTIPNWRGLPLPTYKPSPFMKSHIQPITFHKVKAHTKNNGNKQAYVVTKWGRNLDHRDATTPYRHAYPTPYFLQKYWWHSMQETPNKGHIRHLRKHVLNYDKRHNLEAIANQTHQLHK